MKKRTLVAAGLAIAVLFGGSMAVVLLLSGRGGTPRSAPDALDTAASPPPAAPVATTPPPAAAAGAVPLKVRASSWNAPGEGPSPVPMASRAIRKVVRKALLAGPVQAQLARCADRPGGFGGTAAHGPIQRGKPAVLMLELEALEGEVRIVDAQVQRWGGASDASVSCARGVLEGHVVATPARRKPASGTPQERMRMPFTLNPRSQVVASFR